MKENLTSIKALGTELESFEATTKELKQKLLQAGCIKQGEIEDENPISVFRPLLWDKSALLSKLSLIIVVKNLEHFIILDFLCQMVNQKRI